MENTFNPGSQTILIDGVMGDFKYKRYPREMQFKCSVVPIGLGDAQKMTQDSQVCQSWTPTKRGIKAYKNNIPSSFVDFDIVYPAFFEEGGSTTFKYLKDSVPSTLEETSD